MNSADSIASGMRGRAARSLVAILVLAALCLGVFGPALLDRDRSLSHISGDTSQFFFAMRKFGAEEIQAGRLPLWNPYLMSGTPYVGNFQSAIFYPPNAMYLVMPIADAADADYALHTFLFGLFTFLWVRRRGVSRPGAVLSGTMAMFSSTFFLRILGGQLTMVDAMAWAPLLLLSVDAIFDRAGRRRPLTGPVLLGAAATALQILSGHPQTVFITGFTIALYCALRMPGAAGRTRAVVAFLVLAIWGVMMSAAQLLPGLQTMTESVRTGVTGTNFSETFSFPAENLLTLLAPNVFGDRVHFTYWGQWAPWDAIFFLGVVALVLAGLGARHATAAQRRYATFLIVLIVFLAMGSNAPVYQLFSNVPIFGVLRGVSKFLFVATLFAALLAGFGFDVASARDAARNHRAAMAALALVPPLLLGAGAIMLAASTGGGERWRQTMFREMSDSLFINLWFTEGPDFHARAARWAAGSLVLAACTLGVVVALLIWSRRSRWAVRLMLVAAIGELAVYATANCDTFAASDLHPREPEAFYAAHPSGDWRVAEFRGPDVPYARNLPMDVRRSAVWGYEPVMLHRYATFLVHGIGGGMPRVPGLLEHVRWGSDVIELGMNSGFLDLKFDTTNRIFDPPREFDLLRCRYALVPDGLPSSPAGIYENPDALPRFMLARDYLVLSQPWVILDGVTEKTFDPRRQVILEQEPDPAPNPADGPADAEVIVEDESSDHMTLRVTLDKPAILLVTDPYSGGWGTLALPDSVQQSYQTLPADFALRAVPLSAGSHHFRMEYRPRAFVLGVSISCIAVIAFAAALTYWGTSAAGVYFTQKAP